MDLRITDTFKSSLGFLCVMIGFYLYPFTASRAQNRQDLPNILWITSEDNSPYLGAYGDSLADTPNLDHLADRGIVYDNAFTTSPVCSPARFTLITGTYSNMMGTEYMHSTHPIPEQIQFYPQYLRRAGYFTTNNAKEDYNTIYNSKALWNESSDSATYKDRAPGQPFFHVRNLLVTHEPVLTKPVDSLMHDPDKMEVPPYLPETSAVKRDFAHFYDAITEMDAQVGKILDELEVSGEAENTIVIYCSDHGGVLPRSKKFVYDSGLKIPLIVYIPPKYADLIPPDVKNGRTDRLVSFIDFSPTILSLAGIKPPEYMPGRAFLGEYTEPAPQYVHAYRNRIDESFELMRVLRDKDYLYIRNFMPQRIYGQHMEYSFRSAGYQSWMNEFNKGTLNETQLQFFKRKPAEELYRVDSDPNDIHNLAGDPKYSSVLERMRRINSDWMHNNMDLGFIPEEMIDSLRRDESLYKAVRDKSIPIDRIIETAELATRNVSDNIELLASRLNDPNGAVRFWAATGFSVAIDRPKDMEQELLNHWDDPEPAVRVAVAEALYRYGDHNIALRILKKSLDAKNLLVVLRALNTIDALDISSPPTDLVNMIRKIRDTHDVEGGGIGNINDLIVWATNPILGVGD